MKKSSIKLLKTTGIGNRLCVGFICYLFSSFSAISQSKKETCMVQVAGYAESLRLAYLDATNKAYYELVAQCGKGVKVSATALDEVSASSTQFQANSYESMLVGLDGLVTDFEVLDTSKYSIENGRYVKVVMQARGTVYSDTASNTIIDVTGINAAYNVGEALTFDISSDSEMSLWIYQVKDEVATLFLPHEKYLPVLRIEEDETIHFPPVGRIVARLENERVSTEIINWVIIATKRKDPWAGQMDLNELVERYSLQKGAKDIKVVKAAITR